MTFRHITNYCDVWNFGLWNTNRHCQFKWNRYDQIWE